MENPNKLKAMRAAMFELSHPRAAEKIASALIELAGAEGNTAMTLLAARTIDVLSHEPMRVFGKAYTDASPASSVVELLAAKPNKE